VLLPQGQHAIDCGRHPRCGSVRFHQHIHEMEALAEPAFNDRRVPCIGIGAGKASAPFDDVGGSAEARLGQKGGRDTALGGVRSLNAFSGGAGIVELCDAAGIAARQSDGFLDSPAGIAAAEDEPRRSRSRPEHVTGSGALEAAPEMAGLQREADPDDHLVTRHDRSQHLRSGLTDVLSRRQRGRPHRHARMQHRPDVSVVGIEARAERDVHEGCVLRIERARGKQDVRGALLADQADVPARPIAPGQPRPDRADAKVIEQEPTELLPYFGGQRGGVEIGCERSKRLGRLMGCHDGHPRTPRLSSEQARAGKPQLRITWPT